MVTGSRSSTTTSQPAASMIERKVASAMTKREDALMARNVSAMKLWAETTAAWTSAASSSIAAPEERCFGHPGARVPVRRRTSSRPRSRRRRSSGYCKMGWNTVWKSTAVVAGRQGFGFPQMPDVEAAALACAERATTEGPRDR